MQSKQNNPTLDYSFNHAFASVAEVNLFLITFGGKKMKVQKSTIETYFGHEQFPADYQRPELKLTIPRFGTELAGLVARGVN